MSNEQFQQEWTEKQRISEALNQSKEHFVIGQKY
jgi:hypothetical protein